MRASTAIFTAISLVLTLVGSAYADKDKDKQRTLPPGLQKKVERGEALPPGWQKKLIVGEPLDAEFFELGEVVDTDEDAGTATVKVEDTLIRVIDSTREIVEILEGLD